MWWRTADSYILYSTPSLSLSLFSLSLSHMMKKLPVLTSYFLCVYVGMEAEVVMCMCVCVYVCWYPKLCVCLCVFCYLQVVSKISFKSNWTSIISWTYLTPLESKLVIIPSCILWCFHGDCCLFGVICLLLLLDVVRYCLFGFICYWLFGVAWCLLVVVHCSLLVFDVCLLFVIACCLFVVVVVDAVIYCTSLWFCA